MMRLTIRHNPVVAVVNVENLPAKPLQTLRKKMRGSVLITMSKKPFIKRAIEKQDKKDFGKLTEYISGMPAIPARPEIAPRPLRSRALSS